jgi:hypothetical protein
MPHPPEFAEYLNTLKRAAEHSMLTRGYTPAEAQSIVQRKLDECNDVLRGEPWDVVFLVAGSVLANILDGYGAPE